MTTTISASQRQKNEGPFPFPMVRGWWTVERCLFKNDFKHLAFLKIKEIFRPTMGDGWWVMGDANNGEFTTFNVGWQYPSRLFGIMVVNIVYPHIYLSTLLDSRYMRMIFFVEIRWPSSLFAHNFFVRVFRQTRIAENAIVSHVQ